MAIGQVVYNLHDFHSGGLVSTSEANVSQTIYEATATDYEGSRIKIFEDESANLVAKFGASSFTKLGIQAPPGTKIKLNSRDKIVMIGRTGVYELDEDIEVSYLTFIRPKKYILNTALTAEKLESGKQAILAAEGKRTTDMNQLNADYATKPKDSEYWDRYTTIQGIYDSEYREAQVDYIAGVNGVYRLPNPDKPDASENYEELYDVIIDFLY